MAINYIVSTQSTRVVSKSSTVKLVFIVSNECTTVPVLSYVK